jgi:4-amino-4-deoxy-L-arabinose transferase-like glycosyltransferase
VLFLPGIVLAGFVPWTCLVLAGTFRLLPFKCNVDWQRTPGCVLIGAWAAVGILPFALSRTQLPVYVMPAFPAVALIAGWCLDQVLTRNLRWELGFVLVGTVVIMVMSLISLAVINRYTWNASAWTTLAGRGVILGGVLAFLFVLWRRARPVALATTCLSCAVAGAVHAAWVEGPALSRHFSSHRFTTPVAEKAGDADLLVIGPAPRYALPFYLKPKKPVVYLPHVVDFARYGDHPEALVALFTSRNLYELARGQLGQRMQVIASTPEGYLVRIVPRLPTTQPALRNEVRPVARRLLGGRAAGGGSADTGRAP